MLGLPEQVSGPRKREKQNLWWGANSLPETLSSKGVLECSCLIFLWPMCNWDCLCYTWIAPVQVSERITSHAHSPCHDPLWVGFRNTIQGSSGNAWHETAHFRPLRKHASPNCRPPSRFNFTLLVLLYLEQAPYKCPGLANKNFILKGRSRGKNFGEQIHLGGL